MGDFPFFRSIEGKRVLVAGGGSVALRRARTLSAFGPRLTVVAETFSEKPELPGTEYVQRAFRDGDLDGAEIVVAATDDRRVNGRIVELCRARGIEVNAADDPDGSTFHFPAVVRRGEMTVGIGSGGAAPALTALLRSRIEESLPENTEALVSVMERARRSARERISDPDSRGRALRAVLERCMQPGPLPDDEETESIIRRYPCTEKD